MKQIDYTNKPSITTLKAAIKKAIATGETWIQTQWGWVGGGWIGRNGGQDLANEIQRSKA